MTRMTQPFPMSSEKAQFCSTEIIARETPVESSLQDAIESLLRIVPVRSTLVHPRSRSIRMADPQPQQVQSQMCAFGSLAVSKMSQIRDRRLFSEQAFK